jgi:hypothetical protein
LLGLSGDGALEGEFCLLGLVADVDPWGEAFSDVSFEGVEREGMGESPPMEKDIVSEWAELANSSKILLKSWADPLARIEAIRFWTTEESRYSGAGTKYSATGMSQTSPNTLLSDSDAQRV